MFANLFLCLILLTISYITAKLTIKSNIITSKDSFESFKRTIFKYKINNFFFTIMNSLIYLITTVIFFFYLRLIVLGNTTLMTKYHISILTANNILLIILNLILVLLSITFYLNIINNISYFDIIRFRIYLDNNHYYYVFRDMLCFNYILKLCEFLWFYCYRIASLTFPAEITFKQQIHEDEYQYLFLYTHKIVMKITKCLMFFGKKHKAFCYLFYKIASLFKLFYKLMTNGFFSYTHYIIFLLVFFYDLKNAQLYYIYYVGIISFIIISIRTFRKFENSLDLQNVSELHDLYYKSNTILLENLLKTLYNENNSILLKSLRDQLKMPTVIISSENRRIKLFDILHYAKIHIIFAIIATFFIFSTNIEIILIGYTISFNHFSILLIGVFILIIKKNYYKIYINENTIYEKLFEYHYNYKFELIFWILTLSTIFFIWFVFIIPEVFFINNEILIELPKNLFKVIKNFSKEEKISYLFQLFEYYLQNIQFEKITNDKENLRYLLRQLDWNSLITNEIILKDLQVYIALLFDTKITYDSFLEHFCAEYVNYIEQLYTIEQKRKNIKDKLEPIMSSIILIVFKLFIRKYLIKNSPQILLHKFITNTNSFDIIKIIKTLHNILKR